MVTQHMVLGSEVASVVIQNTEQGVQSVDEHVALKHFDKAAWDDLQVFRSVAATKSFREAARSLSVSVNTVRAGISRLESTLNSALFSRSREGIKLSQDGLAVLDIAIEMQSIGARLRAGNGNNAVVKPGEIRICCSEGIGEFWLTPRLTSLQDRLPRHSVALQHEYDQSKIHCGDHDLRIGFSRPQAADAIVSKLASLHFIMYASSGYIARFGEPTSLNDALKHRFVIQDAPGTPDFASLFLGADTGQEIISTRVNTSYSLFQAISNGVGIGALPTYVCTQSTDLRPLYLPVQLKFDLWLSFEPWAKDSFPVRTAIEWLRDCFDAEKYPWFASDFVHPDEFDQSSSTFNSRLTMPVHQLREASL
jgi:DNA-binding transcriptional LysR family regulator